ncbi:hypothetical protein [Bradyrhizobium sp. RT7b]|uniref:hypothetical protein n=1 Tax=unclassified Bradyrhizobium TaxID=2631580 RepID=UPI003393978A
MQAVFFLAYIAIFVAQVSAGMEGMQLYWSVGSFVSFILFVLAAVLPVVGSFLAAAAVYYGAHSGWQRRA